MQPALAFWVPSAGGGEGVNVPVPLPRQRSGDGERLYVQRTVAQQSRTGHLQPLGCSGKAGKLSCWDCLGLSACLSFNRP